MNKTALLLCSLLLAAPALLFSEGLDLSLNKENGVYQKGETVELSIALDSPATAPLQLKIQQDNHQILDQTTPFPTGTKSQTIRYTFETAGGVIFEATCGDASDTIGIIVSPQDLQPGSKRPQDFDTYWKKQKTKSKKLPLKVKKQAIELTDSDSGYQAFDVEINSLGPRPMRAIFAKPSHAQPGTLPIVIQFRAAGVKGEWCRAKTEEALAFAKRGNGALALDTNAHGMLNHEDEAYFEDLENGLLKEYWSQGNTDRDTFYFRFMYLRLLRSIEYMTQQPEWDGKRILVIGESQGGGQALAAAGLDPRVTAVVATVPAMCDWGAPLVGRRGGWPQPIDWNRDNEAVLKTVPYFDTAHLLKNSQATIVVEIGLIDQTCPSTSVYAAINQAGGKVIAYPETYRTHRWPEGEDRAHWDVNTAAAKNAFIDDYLK